MISVGGALVLSLFIVGLNADASVHEYKEAHPSVKPCTKKCYDTYWSIESDKEDKCDACCSGCNYFDGLTATEEGVEREQAQKKCYKKCDDENKETQSCRFGCDTELELAEKQMETMDASIQGMKDMMNSLPDMMHSLFNPSPLFNFPSFFGQMPQIELGAPQVVVMEPSENTAVDPLPATESKEEDDLDVLNKILQSMGIFTMDDAESQMAPLVEDEKEVLDSGSRYEGKPRKGGLLSRDEVGVNSEDDQIAYLRSLWRDRNTVQILLISSITACLFAILWMLCNSSNDPVVRRVADEAPPSYNVIYGNDEKKFPILVVAGIEEEADALPQKVPLGYATQI